MGGEPSPFDGRRALFLVRADGSVYGRVAWAGKIDAVYDDFLVWLLLDESVVAAAHLPDEPDFGDGLRLLSHHVGFDGGGILFHHIAVDETQVSCLKVKRNGNPFL